jgi:DNA-binding transcriptional regulator WhiA
MGNSFAMAALDASFQSSMVAENEGQQEAADDELAILRAKIQHRDGKLEELGRVLENLKSANANLHSRNKQLSKARFFLEVLCFISDYIY